jgi:Leucine-rich repeat (LRR) protein
MPETMSNLSKLSLLDIRSNQIQSISEKIYRLPSLTKIILTNNPISESDRNAIAKSVENVQ